MKSSGVRRGVRGAVAPSGLELENDLPGRVGLHALVGDSGARDVAAHLLQRLAVGNATAPSPHAAVNRQATVRATWDGSVR